MRKRRLSGYRSRRDGGGCVTWIIWLGIVSNIGLIIYTMSDERWPSPLALFGAGQASPTAALRAFEAGNLDEAIRLAQVALDTDPTNTDAAMLLTRALVYRSYTDFDRAADLPAAVDVAAATLENLPDDPNALAAYAFALQANGQAVQAVDVAERALAQAPDHTLARTALALGYARVGSFDTALRESQVALANDAGTPARLDARRAVAISLADLGNYTEAGAMLDTLIADYRRLVPLYFERALYARQVSDAATVESAYFTVLTQDENNVKARLRLCEFANSIGERQTALTHCQQVTQQAPALVEGWYQLGRLHFLSGAFEQAQAALNRCSSLQMQQNRPPNARIFECWYLQGQAAEIRGDCEALTGIYAEFQRMATDPRIRETWTYPPEGPPMCQPAEG
jgi:tetratricopeptide (TPR) repeat protein